MLKYIEVMGKMIPSYGVMIFFGVFLANVIAFRVIKKEKWDINDFIIIEAYAFLGGFLGAKLLYLLVSIRIIDWSRFFELAYFNALMQGGFVFYGGLIFGVFAVLLAGKIHGIESGKYIQRFIFLIPFIHAFGRIGCFCAGCCYGIHYEGVGSVVFPHNSLAPHGVHLFPVQLLEAVGLLLISFTIYCVQRKIGSGKSLGLYMIFYGMLRFFDEFLRGDVVRGFFGNLSIAQWISVCVVVVGVILLVWPKFSGTRSIQYQ